MKFSKEKNRHLLEVVQSLIFTNTVPKCYWGDAILTGTYIINRMTSFILNHQTLIQTLLKDYPNTHLLHDIPLKVFGCSSFVHIHSHKRGKLEPGWSNVSFSVTLETRKGYKYYSPNTKHFYTSMDVTFISYEPFYPTPRFRGRFPISNLKLGTHHISFTCRTSCCNPY